MSAMVADVEGGPAAVGGMHEGMVQTSNPFYSGNPSSRIWGPPFFCLPDPASPFAAVEIGAQSPSPASSFVTAPSGWGGDVANGDRKGAVPVAASPSLSSSSAFPPASSLFLSASSSSSTSSGFSSATSAFSSPAASLSSSSHAGGSGSSESSGLPAGKARRHSSRRDSGSVVRPPVGAGTGVSSATHRGIGREGDALDGHDPVQNSSVRVPSAGAMNAGGKAGKSGLKAVMKDLSDGNFGDSGFRFNSGNWKPAVDSGRGGAGGATFRFGSENAMPSAEVPATAAFRFGSKVAKPAEDLPGQRVSTATPLSFTSGNLNSGAGPSVTTGFARLDLNSEELTSPTRVPVARSGVGGFVFGAGNLNVPTTPRWKGNTDPVDVRSPRPSVRRDDAFQEVGGENTRTRVKFTFISGSGFEAQGYSGASESSTNAQCLPGAKDRFPGDASSSFSRVRGENARPSAESFPAGSVDYSGNGSLETGAFPIFRAAVKGQETLKQTPFNSASVVDKSAESSGETEPDLGRFVPGGTRQKLSPALEGSAFSAFVREEDICDAELPLHQGAFVFGTGARSQQGRNTGISALPQSRTRMKLKKSPSSGKGKGVGANPSVFADVTSSSTSSTTHGESFSYVQDHEIANPSSLFADTASSSTTHGESSSSVQGLASNKGKGVVAKPSSVFADTASSSATQGESVSSVQGLATDRFCNFKQVATRILGTGRSGDLPPSDVPKPSFGIPPQNARKSNEFSSSVPGSEPEGSGSATIDQKAGTASWNPTYADLLKSFKHSLGIYDDDQSADNPDPQPPSQSAVPGAPVFEFQMSGGLSAAGSKVEPFVFGSTIPGAGEIQQNGSTGKRRKGKVYVPTSTRRYGKTNLFKQEPTTNSDDRNPSPMDFSPRDEDAMEEDDGLKSLRTAAANLSIGKGSILEEVASEQQYFGPRTVQDGDGSPGLSKSGKRVATDSSSVLEDGESMDNSGDSNEGTSGWAGFVFSAGSSQTSPGVQRRHTRKTYREKGPEMRKFVRVKGQTSSASVDAETDQSIADELSERLHLTRRSTTRGPRDPERQSSFGSGSGTYENYGRASPEAAGPFWAETRVGTLTTPCSPPAAVAVAAEQACEKWRLRGNQAYESGDFSKAEECYSRGAGSVSSHLTSQSCVRALTLCYSNRAATRMAVGRMRDAIGDCIRAVAVDPKFLRVKLRLANCHLSLGESAAASSAFKECLRKVTEDHPQDSKIAAEAAEGLKKIQLVQEYTDRALELLANSNVSDVTTALRLVTDALKNSQYSENLLELKAIALVMLRKYEDAEQLCEQTLAAAERNFVLSDISKSSNGDGSSGHACNTWRWKIVSKCKFHLGKLEEALEYLKRKEESMPSVSDRPDYWHVLELKSLHVSAIRDLLRHKTAGNEAFQVGRHAEAVEQYTAALACNGDSRPFNAVCLCNRAAASQALGHIADAIADCSRAIALDPKYAKAISRRATLHELVRDYSQSVSDLQRLVSLLESQLLQAKGGVNRVSRPNSAAQDLNQARERLGKAQEELRLRKKDHALDHYLILGVDKNSTTAEIKKAYRKAALRHHPDKAGQFVVWSEGGDETLWREIRDEVRHDAERLFKLIGEAHAVLSDQIKRNQYDKLEEAKKIGMQGVDIFADCTRSTRHHHDPSHRYEPWSGYSHQHHRWQSGPDAAQPDTYARRARNGSHSYGAGDGGGRRAEYDWDD